MKAAFVDQTKRFSLERDEESGRCFLAIPVSNRMADYLEWYEVDAETFERFLANPALAHPMVEQAKRRELDHLLLFKPGSDRGVP